MDKQFDWVGEFLVRSWMMFRAAWAQYVAAAAVIAVPWTALLLLFGHWLRVGNPPLGAGFYLPGGLNNLIRLPPALVILTLVGFAVSAWQSAALLSLFRAQVSGESPQWLAGIREGVQFIVPVALANLLIAVITFLVAEPFTMLVLRLAKFAPLARAPIAVTTAGFFSFMAGAISLALRFLFALVNQSVVLGRKNPLAALLNGAATSVRGYLPVIVYVVLVLAIGRVVGFLVLLSPPGARAVISFAYELLLSAWSAIALGLIYTLINPPAPPPAESQNHIG